MNSAIQVFALVVPAAGSLRAVVSRQAVDVAQIEASLQAVGIWAPALIAALFAAAIPLFLPGTMFALTCWPQGLFWPGSSRRCAS